MKKKFGRIKTVFVLVLCISALVLSSCGKGNDDPGEGKVTDTPTGNEPAVTADPTGPEDTPAPTGEVPTQNPGQNRPVPTTVIDKSPTEKSVSSLAPEQNKKPELVDGYREVELEFKEDGTYKFKQVNCFYNEKVKLTITAPEGAVVYYTLDGTEPNVYSAYYVEPIVFDVRGGSFPEAYVFRAAVIDEDWNMSNVAARTFLVGGNLDKRFSTVVFFHIKFQLLFYLEHLGKVENF